MKTILFGFILSLVIFVLCCFRMLAIAHGMKPKFTDAYLMEMALIALLASIGFGVAVIVNVILTVT